MSKLCWLIQTLIKKGGKKSDYFATSLIVMELNDISLFFNGPFQDHGQRTAAKQTKQKGKGLKLTAPAAITSYHFILNF